MFFHQIQGAPHAITELQGWEHLIGYPIQAFGILSVT